MLPVGIVAARTRRWDHVQLLGSKRDFVAGLEQNVRTSASSGSDARPD